MSTVTPVRRIGRVRRTNSLRAEDAQSALERLLQSIATTANDVEVLQAQNIVLIEEATRANNATIAELDEKRAELEKEVEQVLKQAKMEGFTDGKWRAEFVNSYSKEVREVDIDKLQKALKPELFLQCIKPQIALMKELMSDREIEAVCTRTPAKLTGTALVVTQVKSRGKK